MEGTPASPEQWCGNSQATEKLAMCTKTAHLAQSDPKRCTLRHKVSTKEWPVIVQVGAGQEMDLL